MKPAPPPGQLRWRCRRGMKELDILLRRYLDERYEAAAPAEQAAFRALLELPDPVLYGYCLGRRDSGAGAAAPTAAATRAASAESTAPSAEVTALIEQIAGRAADRH